MSAINALFSNASPLAGNFAVGEPFAGSNADKTVTYVFTPAELGVSAKHPPRAARVTEQRLEAALFKHFGLNPENAADKARLQELLKTESSPFSAVETTGNFTAVYNKKTGNYEKQNIVKGELYRQLQGKAAEVKTQVEAEKSRVQTTPTANPTEAMAAKTGVDAAANRRSALEAKLEASNQANAALVSPMSAKHGITPEQAAADKEAAKVWLDQAGKTINGAAAAYLEDQFGVGDEFFRYWNLEPPDLAGQNAAGRAAGHTASAVQAAAEIAAGSTMVGGGTVLDLTGVGAIAGVPAIAAGAGMVVHGVATGANTINNINHDPLLNKDASATSSGTKAAAETAEQIAQREAAERGAKIETRYNELDGQGHAPARHGEKITETQLDDRAMHGKDPITGTTDDAFNKFPDGTPKPHNTGKNATKFNSKEALVKAEEYAHNTTEYKNAIAQAEAAGDNYITVKNTKLQDVFGANYKDQVFGKTRIGSRNNPTGSVETDFTDGTLTAKFKKDGSGNWNLDTMFPEPK